jgi:hypothetical protein
MYPAAYAVKYLCTTMHLFLNRLAWTAELAIRYRLTMRRFWLLLLLVGCGAARPAFTRTTEDGVMRERMTFVASVSGAPQRGRGLLVRSGYTDIVRGSITFRHAGAARYTQCSRVQVLVDREEI